MLMDYCLHQKTTVLPNLAPGNDKVKRASNPVSLAIYSDLWGSALLVDNFKQKVFSMQS